MTQSSGCDTVDNINNGIQNSVFMYNIGSRLLGHIVCINLIWPYRNLRVPSRRQMRQIKHIIWDFFENGSVAKRLNKANVFSSLPFYLFNLIKKHCSLLTLGCWVDGNYNTW